MEEPLFDKLTNRHGTSSYKWDDSVDPDVIPMWVADMDFETAPLIRARLKERIEHGIFGYVKVPDSYYESLIGWFESRHGWRIERDWVIYTSGVVPAVSAIIKALTSPGDEVIVQTPAYNCFFSSVRNNGCQMSENRLIYDRESLSYSVDFEDLERKASNPRARVLLLCNPHNPSGRVWREDELRRIGDICLRHDVWVISDEIHCELTAPGTMYVPYGTLGDEYLSKAVICSSPSKSFNIAGLQIANIVCPDSGARSRIDRAINDNEVCDVNPFGVVALEAAYSSASWLDSLRDYIWENYSVLSSFFSSRMPYLKVLPLEGTYLVWADCSSLGMESEEIETRMRDEAHVWLNAGSMYGEAGEGFMRINIACPRKRLLEALDRMEKWFSERRMQCRQQ